MTASSQVAAVQLTATDDVGANIEAAVAGIARAAEQGAQLVVLPENVAFLGASETAKLAVAEAPGDGWIQSRLAQAALDHGIWVVAGTVPLRSDEPDRVTATCLVFDDKGSVRARYDKLHMFDVDAGDGEPYKESHTLKPGQRPVVVDTPIGRVGLAICYDLRFPELFRCLLDAGARVLAVPAAFTVPTGAAHWEMLLRARAVENLCSVVAADQVGTHPSGRASFGDSMIIDPWGRVLARRVSGDGVVTAAMDAGEQADLRQRFPALSHRRALLDAVDESGDETASTPLAANKREHDG